MAALALGAEARIGADNTITTTTTDGRTVIVKALTPNILRITNLQPGQQPLPSRAVVIENSLYKPDVTNAGKYVSTLSTSAGITAMVADRTG